MKARNQEDPECQFNKRFISKVVKIRNEDDYGSEKIHYVLKQEGFAVSQHIIQRVLDEQGLTDPCPKRRGQRSYVRYQWPLSNYMWHCDWSQYKGEWYCAFIDDRSRKIMAAAKFKEATTEHALFILHQATLIHEVCPVVILSDKGAQFYASKYDKKGKKGFSQFEKTLDILGIDFWTARRGHPQTNGKMEKWFDTMKKRFKKHPDHTLQEFVEWYNEKRIHHALQYGTPDNVYYEKL
jgi:putative transposase